MGRIVSPCIRRQESVGWQATSHPGTETSEGLENQCPLAMPCFVGGAVRKLRGMRRNRIRKTERKMRFFVFANAKHSKLAFALRSSPSFPHSSTILLHLHTMQESHGGIFQQCLVLREFSTLDPDVHLNKVTRAGGKHSGFQAAGKSFWCLNLRMNQNKVCMGISSASISIPPQLCPRTAS